MIGLKLALPGIEQYASRNSKRIFFPGKSIVGYSSLEKFVKQ